MPLYRFNNGNSFLMHPYNNIMINFMYKLKSAFIEIYAYLYSIQLVISFEQK